MSRKIGVILSYVLMIFEVMSTLLLTPFIIRTLGQAEYGVYRLTVAINAYLLLLDLGVGNATIRYISKFRANNERENERKFLGVATIFYCIIALLAIIAGIVVVAIFPTAFSKGLSPDETALGQKLLVITTINSAITLGTTAYNNILIAYEKFAVSRIVSIIQLIAKMILIYIVLKMGYGSIGILLTGLLATLICRFFFVGYVLLSIRLRPIFKNIQTGFIKEIVLYSAFILLQMVATQLNASVDQVLIGSLVTSSSIILAVYSVGTQVTQYYQMIGSAFTNVLMPGVVQMVEKKSNTKIITDEMIRIGRIILIVLSMIWTVFLTSGKQFIALWAGDENIKAYYVSLILMFAYMFILTESIGTQILWAMNEHKEQAVLKMGIVVINLIITALLIQWNPLIGATIGTFISLMLGDVGVMNLIFKKKLSMDLVYYYKGLFKGVLPSIIVCMTTGIISTHFVKGGWGAFAINVLVSALAYIIMMFLIGFNSYEKNLIFSIAKKLKK